MANLVDRTMMTVVQKIADYLKMRDETLTPGDADEAERLTSAFEIVELMTEDSRQSKSNIIDKYVEDDDMTIDTLVDISFDAGRAVDAKILQQILDMLKPSALNAVAIQNVRDLIRSKLPADPEPTIRVGYQERLPPFTDKDYVPLPDWLDPGEPMAPDDIRIGGSLPEIELPHTVSGSVSTEVGGTD